MAPPTVPCFLPFFWLFGPKLSMNFSDSQNGIIDHLPPIFWSHIAFPPLESFPYMRNYWPHLIMKPYDIMMRKLWIPGLWSLGFDSYMIPTQGLVQGNSDLLEAAHRMVIPTRIPPFEYLSPPKMFYTHGPSQPLGVKMDAVPGRLNQTAFIASRPGVFFGQCSEICGANHSFMPIVVEAIPLKHFENWSSLMLKDA
uniref:cytochrome-c oxidase n=2 Tax=Odontobutis TaxID=86243 RepID=W6D6G2_9GOBI|nr:cytochrome c oxidase subunit II [Odontobutis potamophila]ALL96728.1 cytochrome c oxidase subunit II [Odontobutis obscura]